MTDSEAFVFRIGGRSAPERIPRSKAFDVFTEDAFSGKLTSTKQCPRTVAPFPKVNPLAGPFAFEGVLEGDVLAIHILELKPTRNWGVSAVSPNFGLLSGTRANPNLQPQLAEHVWMWQLSEDRTRYTCSTPNGNMQVDCQPFLGTVAVAPAHGEVRLSIVPGDFGGNLDLPQLGAGTTLYLRANVEGGQLYLGDGHGAQGDGEICGTAIEIALQSRLAVDRLADSPTFDWPRIETGTHIGVVGCGRPLEDAVRIAVSGLVEWIADISGLNPENAHQFVSQACQLRIGNLVNPAFSVLCRIEKSRLEPCLPVMGDLHRQLASLATAE